MIKKIIKSFEMKKEIIYIMLLSVYLIMTILDLNTVIGENPKSFIISIIKYLCIIGILIKILICDVKFYNKSTYVKITILTILSLIIGKISNNRTYIQYLILILGAYKITFKKILKYVLIVEAATVLLIIILSLANIIPNRIFGRSDSDVARYSLGFKYATYPSIYVWYFTMLYLYMRNKKIKSWEYIVLLIINIILYISTDSRNELICSIIIIVLDILYNRIKNKNFEKILHVSAKYLMILFTIISILLAFIYNPQNEVMKKANSIFSNRLYLSHKALDEYGIKLFGNKIEWVGLSLIHYGEFSSSHFNYVDISYLNILLNFGLIALILILFAFYKITDNEIKNGNTFICCFMIVIAIHSFIDPQLFQITYNIFILLFVDLIVNKKELKDQDLLTEKKGEI